MENSKTRKMENSYFQVGEDKFYERIGEQWFYFIFAEKRIKTGFLESLEINEPFEPLLESIFRKEVDLRLKYFCKKFAQ